MCAATASQIIELTRTEKKWRRAMELYREGERWAMKAVGTAPRRTNLDNTAYDPLSYRAIHAGRVAAMKYQRAAQLLKELAEEKEAR